MITGNLRQSFRKPLTILLEISIGNYYAPAVSGVRDNRRLSTIYPPGFTLENKGDDRERNALESRARFSINGKRKKNFVILLSGDTEYLSRVDTMVALYARRAIILS